MEVTSDGIQIYYREILKKGQNYQICAPFLIDSTEYEFENRKSVVLVIGVNAVSYTHLRIFAFEGNGHLTQYEGGYTDYTEALARKGGAVSELSLIHI